MWSNQIGVAYCIGLREEARISGKIFRDNGLKVSSVPCMVGSVCWEVVGIKKPTTGCNIASQISRDRT